MFRVFRSGWSLAALIPLALTVGAASGGIGPQGKTETATPDFMRDIFPVIKGKCASCHSSQAPSGGLALDSPEGLQKGGASGRTVVSKKSGESLLVKRILGLGDKPQMPMGFAPLDAKTIKKIRAWIDAGADFGSGKKAKHWAYVPPKRPSLPKVASAGPLANPIDLFVLGRLKKEGLSPSPQADKETLCRRVYLDLTGLPPTVEQQDEFLNDTSPHAYEFLVDRLLASPHYGEKMARAWLDVARYADTNGYEKDLPRQMWLWRDWVIDAFNSNMPYDRFTIEQLAGDLLPNPTPSQRIATGFHRNSMLNDEGGIDPEEFRVVAVMDRIDATTTTWLGTTLACAQCHNHKYDPLPQRDYYGMFAFFNQSADNGRDIDPILRVPSPLQKAELDRLEVLIAKAETERLARTPTALSHQADWERSVLEGWSALRPSKWESQATLNRLPDQSLLASGADPVEDLYIVEYPVSAGLIAGLRVEALPDPSLPEGSSGRNFNGNFVLRKVEASLRHSDGKTTPLKFNKAGADFTQGGHDPMTTIHDGDLPGWAIAGFQPEQRVRHELVLRASVPAATANGDVLIVRYIHQSRHKNHNLGRFRLSTTSDGELAGMKPLPNKLFAAIQKPRETRSAEESEALQNHYLSVTPDLADVNAELSQAKQQKADIESKLPTVMVMRERETPRQNHLLERGDFRTPGAFVMPHTPVALGGWSTRPDRLGLARWIVDRQNPLSARVMVNRLWEQCFGHGIVATMEDFGTQGERPTHPELLDWLAVEFMESGWNVKGMLRKIVTSKTYKQASSADVALIAKDPQNHYLARGPRFRLDAEGIRDAALLSSGRLTPTVGGPSVMPPQPPGVWENSFTFYDTKDRWVDAEGPNRYRRGLYTYWRRTAPYPMALTFDLKQRDTCVATRSRTNTPLQALNLLNDPTFVECAGGLAEKLAKTAHNALSRGPSSAIVPAPDHSEAAIVEAIRYGFRSCTSRMPTEREVAVLESLYERALAQFEKDADAASNLLKAARTPDGEGEPAERAAWVAVANALLNLDETLTKR